jgi:cytochrome c556
MSAPGRLDLFGDVANALESQGRLNDSFTRAFETFTDALEDVWQDNADLRDELHALANRVEALTRAVGRDAA